MFATTVMEHRRASMGVALLVALLASGCAAHRRVVPAQPPASFPAEEIPASPEELSEPLPPPKEAPPRPRLRDLCREPGADAPIDKTRRMLEQTFCTATLWFDGLFGHELDVGNARRTSGGIELANLYTQFGGLDTNARVRLRYDLPNWDRRVNLFLGRDDRQDFISDQQSGFNTRSSIFGLDSQEKWLAGLGYTPGATSKLDFRVGARVRTAPTVFAQGRYRQSVYVGDNAVWHFRETLFWENREGFGGTTSADYDRLIRSDLVFRSASVGTLSQSTDGVAWHQSFLLYHNLWHAHAIAGEIFVRGESDAEVPLQEYGARGIYRFPIGKPYFFIELITGYSWPREELTQVRKGSAMAGIGFELLFGRNPY